MFTLRFNVPVNKLSVMSRQSHQNSDELMSLAKGHNTMPPVGIEPRALPLRHRASPENKVMVMFIN